jgi:predicted patatin/cPLA2 family phospholipase
VTDELLAPDGVQEVSISGVRSESVFELLRQRLARGDRADGQRLGLVVEGGAMRGVYSAGSLLGLHAMGAASLFDDIYATSAGAVNAAYFLSGSGHLGADSYYRVLADGRFLDWKRPWKFVDIDFLADEVFTRLRPMQTDVVMASSTRLWVAVTDFLTSKTQVLCAQTAGYPLPLLLKAAVALPVAYNRLIPLGEMRAFDAGIVNPFPLREALADGCTHVLVLLSRPATHRSRPSTFWQRALFELCFARGNTTLSRALVNKWRVSGELRDLATGITRSAGFDPAIATICPTNALVQDTTQKVPVLRTQLISCARGTASAFAMGGERLEQWIRDEHI